MRPEIGRFFSVTPVSIKLSMTLTLDFSMTAYFGSPSVLFFGRQKFTKSQIITRKPNFIQKESTVREFFMLPTKDNFLIYAIIDVFIKYQLKNTSAGSEL